MASLKRQPPGNDGQERKKGKTTESDMSYPRVVLNPADCDIDFNVEGEGLRGSGLYEEGFSYCWSGARANVGITGGKYCFGCKIVSAQPVDMKDTPLDQQHICRLGISRGDDIVGNLGESAHSFGFGGTGKFSNSAKFSDYGEKFGVGDTIICAVALENEHTASIGFSKNGKWLGIAKHFDAGPRGLRVVNCLTAKLQWESAIFPHVLLKNVVVQLQFSIDDGLVPQEGYKPWASAFEDGKAVLGPAFPDRGERDVIMMVGLPASGKTTWAEKWVKEHPEKRYVLLGTNLALEQMKVPGLLRKHNYGERFKLLMDCATGIFNTLLSRASKIPRNFIIDQTNVYKSARKRKLKPFADYRKIAVVVFPRPEELKSRAAKRFKEMGKEVPAEAVNSMLANYTLPMSKDMPGTDEYFDEVLFMELNRAESQRFLEEMKRDLPSVHGASSHTGISFQNQTRSPGIGGQWSNSYSSQPPAGSCYGSYYSSYIRGVVELDQSYVGGNAYNSARVESQSFYPPATTDPGRRIMINGYLETSPPSNSTYYGYASQGPPPAPSLPATGRPSYHSSSYPTTIHRPPDGNFPNDVHHAAGVYAPPRQPPLPGNIPMSMAHSGAYPPPRPRPGYY